MDGQAQRLFWFSEENLKLEVPFFQRPYVWNEDNWKTLLDNIIKEKDMRMPFIGSFIFQKTSEDNKVLVIDGQQRITTLSVLIKAYLDVCGHSLPAPAFTGFKGIIYDSKMANMMQYVYTPRLIPSNSDKFGFDIVMKEEVNYEEIENCNSNIALCYKYFNSSFKKMSNEMLNMIGSKILTTRKFFIVITLDPKHDDEQEIFDTVNSLGQRLTCADIIKNYLYQSMKNKVNNDDILMSEIMMFYTRTWEKVFYENDKKEFWYKIKTLGRISSTNLEAFLKDYATIKKIYRASENGGIDGLANSYKRYLDKLNYSQLKNFAVELSAYAQKFYDINIAFDSINDFRIGDRLNTTLLILNKLEYTTFNPYLLKLVKDSPEDIDDKLFALQKFIIIRLIYGASTKNYNKIAETLLDSDNPTEYLRNYNENDNNINYDVFPVGLEYISGRNNKYATLILFIVEMIRRQKNGEDMYSDTLMYNGKSLEHVIPQKWTTKWINVPCYDYNSDGEFEEITEIEQLERVRNRKVYSIGNMTLLTGKLNSSISNEVIEVKVEGKKGKSNGMKKFVGSISVAQEIVDIYSENKRFDERDIYAREEQIFVELNSFYEIALNYKKNRKIGIVTVEETEDVVNMLKNESFTEEYFNNTKIGQLVRESFLYLFENNLLSDDEIKDLMNREYCRKNLGCAFSALVTSEEDTMDSLGRSRFYKEKYRYNGVEYYLCKEWFSNDKKYFVPWIKTKINK